MRRRAAALLLAVLVVAAGLRLGAATGDAGRASCPLKCAHHGDAAAGADCCPLAEAPEGGCALSKCSGDQSPTVAPPVPGQPLILASIVRLPQPGPGRAPAASPAAAPRSAPLPPPDHVPLLLG